MYLSVTVFFLLQICSKIQYCSPAPEMEVKSEMKSQATPFCGVCQMVIQEADSILTDKHNQEAIKNALDVVCSRFR